MEDLIIAAIVIVALLIFWAFVASQSKNRKYFTVKIVDLRDNFKELVKFEVFGPSYQDAKRHALARLKKETIYKEDSDVREFVRIYEMDDGIMAGNEFDILPEALRRLHLDISPSK